MINGHKIHFFLIFFLVLLMMNSAFPIEWSDDPAEIKAYNKQKKEETQIRTVFVEDSEHLPPPTISEWLYKNNFTKRVAVADEEKIPAEIRDKLLDHIKKGQRLRSHGLSIPVQVQDRAMYRERPDLGGTSEALEFGTDVPIRVDTGTELQPDLATGDDGTIYAVWAESFGSNQAIMSSRSDDGGETWSEAIIVDNVGTNYFPQIACWGSGYSARVHVVYNYIDMHIQTLIDIEGGGISYDTVYEGDVYYCRSNNGARSFGHYQEIANSDIDLSDYGIPVIPGIPMSFHYDEGGADVSCDGGNNVYVSYYSQADEGHLINIALWVVYLLLRYLLTGEFGLPSDWFEYTWYTVELRCSSNGGIDFGGEIDIKNEWFYDFSYCAHDVYGTGPNAVVHIAYTDMGIAIPFLPPISNGNVFFRKVRNPLGGGSLTGEVGVWSGYVNPGCVEVDNVGNTKFGYNDVISSYDFDVWYTRSTDGGSSFNIPGIPVATSGADEFEPRLAIDLANNPFIVWSDSRHGHTDVYTVWSEDAGITLRPDQHRVNQYSSSDQQVPGVGLYLDDCVRKLDVDWWDERSDGGDIYFNTTSWWRTNLNVLLNDTLANPMEGTITLTYTSFGQIIEREIVAGYYIVYHDSNTAITLDQMSSGSDGIERWIWSEEGDWTVTPSECGNTYTIVYYDQYNAIFTITHANEAPCTHIPPVDIPFTYYYFASIQSDSTVDTMWADVASFYTYSAIVPDDPVDERWFCPSPSDRILSRTIAPPFYHQWLTPFMNPRKKNNEFCTHTVPSFNLIARYYAGTNVGGLTPFSDQWTDCGSQYEYEDPKNITAYQRWDIDSGAVDIIVDLTPVQPTCYHQWTPIINLVGPECPTNTVWTDAHTMLGARVYDPSLCGTWVDWTDCGTELTFSEFTTLGWVARDPRSWEHVTAVFTATIRYGNVVAVTIQNDFGMGFVGVDSLTPASPFITGWAPASEHEIWAVSPQVFGHTRYVFDHWSDGGDSSHLVSSLVDTTFTCYFNLQYLLELVSDHGDPHGGGWYDEGASATFWVNSYDSAVGGIRHEFVGWEGDGVGSYTGPDTGATVIMDNGITETAEWNTQYYLEITYTGCGTYVPVQCCEGWFNSATHAAITTDSILGGESPDDSTRYIFDHWESFPPGATFGSIFLASTDVFITRPYTVTAVYAKQFKFWVYNPDGFGDPDPPVGTYWFTDSSLVSGHVTSPWDSMYCTGYTGTGSLRDGTRPDFSFIIDEPSSITWHWGEQFALAVIDTTGWLLGLAHAYPPAGTTYYIPGTADLGFVDLTYTFGGNRYYCTGYHGTGAISDGDTNFVAFSMTEPASLEWLWQLQHRFTVTDSSIGDPGEPHYDSPVPSFGEHWYESGSTIVGTITPVAGDYRCVGYVGTGSLPAYGPGSGFTFNITWTSSVTWLWAHYTLVESLVVYTDHGICVPPGSPGGTVSYFLRNTTVNAWTEFTAGGPAGTRYVCTGWTGTGVVPASGATNTVEIIMTDSGTLHWNWTTQYRLTINNPGGYDDPFPPAGEHWYNSGMAVPCSVVTPDTIAPDSIMYCVGFDGTGRSIERIDRSETNFDFVISDPVEITWLWESYMVDLVVISEYGDPSPAGTTYYIPGTGITALVDPVVYDVAEGMRHTCIGYTGTGSVPASGEDSYVYFEIDVPSTLTWHWHTQYRLRIECWDFYGDSIIYGSPSPAVGDHWYDIGTHVTGSIRNPDPRDPSMVCIGFNGTGAAPPVSPQSDFSFDLTEPSSVTWLWYPDSMCAKLTVVSEYDDPHPYGITYWLLGSTVDAEVDTIVYMGELWIVCLGWHGWGSIPASGTDNNVTFDIWEETYLVWDWSENLTFTVENPRGYGDPEPPVGVYSYPVGSFVTGYMDTNPDIDPGTGDTFYCIGYFGTGNLPPVSPQTDFNFTITEPTVLTWRWAPAESVARLDVYSDYDDPHPYGTTYWLIGSVVNAQVNEFEDLTPGYRVYCTGYTGTGDVRDGTGNNFNFVIWHNSSITWQWEMNYQFVIINDGGYDTPVPPEGEYWHPESTWVEGYITDNPAGPLDTMYCIGYEGTGSAPARSHQIDFGFYVTEPSTLTWLWACEHCVAQLVVVSEHDDPHPYGTTYWLIGEFVVAQVDSLTEMVDSSSAFICTGWEGTGSVDSLGDTYWTAFDIFENTTITWLWNGLHYIWLEYDGCPVEPLQTGEGWYMEGDTIEIYSETPVYDPISEGYWGFVWWSSTPSEAIIEDSMRARTDIVVDGSYTFTAHYNPAILHIINKDPLSDIYGWIMVDDSVYESTASINQWWGIGSIHEIGVSEFDTIAYARYQFDSWSDAGARIHVTDPVPGDVLDTTYKYTAYYTALFMCTILKNPLHTCGTITVDSTVYDTTGTITLWWLPGSVHEIGVSTPDYCDTMAYFFESWSDSGDTFHWTDTTTGPTVFVANYTTKYRLTVQKQPLQSYGWIKFERDTTRAIGADTFWVFLDSLYDIGVSEYDLGPVPRLDSVYIFSKWIDDTLAMMEREVGPVEGHSEYVADYLRELTLISFSLNRNWWQLDTMELNTTKDMEIVDSIQIFNNGNCPVDLGLQIVSAAAPGYPDVWDPGYSPNHNRYVLRARFNDFTTPPLEFSPSFDNVKEIMTWATVGAWPLLGEGGVCIYPNYPDGRHPDPECTEFLWMEFLSPLTSRVYTTEVTITIDLFARPYLP